MRTWRTVGLACMCLVDGVEMYVARYRRLGRRFESELALWGAAEDIHMVIIATFSVAASCSRPRRSGINPRTFL